MAATSAAVGATYHSALPQSTQMCGQQIPEHPLFWGAKKSLKRNRRQSIFPSAVLRIDLQRVILVGHAAGDEFQPGAAAAAEGNEAGTACVERLAGFESGGFAGETAEFLFEEIHGDASLI